jgi:tetratricopeptide (TPR) repeat protein
MERALQDPEPLVRAVAALRIASQAALVPALHDPVRSVRVGAVLSLVNLRVPRPSGQDGGYFDRARQEYIARAAIQPDDGAEQFTLGGFQLFSGEPAAAVISLENSLRLDPTLPARYFLAGAWLELNKPEEAVKTLRSTPPADPYFAAARRMLSVLKK